MHFSLLIAQGGEQSPVDRGQSGANQQHAAEGLQRKSLIQKQDAEQYRADRNKKSNQKGVGGAGGGKEAKIHDVRERRAQYGKSDQRSPSVSAGVRQVPRPIGNKGDRHEHQGAGGDLTGRDGERWHD